MNQISKDSYEPSFRPCCLFVCFLNCFLVDVAAFIFLIYFFYRELVEEIYIFYGELCNCFFFKFFCFLLLLRVVVPKHEKMKAKFY